MAQWAKDGLVNMVGGCCGTTPDHIKLFAEQCALITEVRKVPEHPKYMRLSGLHTSAYVSIRPHTSAYVCSCTDIFSLVAAVMRLSGLRLNSAFIYIYIYVYTYIYICIYIHAHIYMYVCMLLCDISRLERRMYLGVLKVFLACT